MAGATSLIQLILKKWGDDAAGAAKELEEKVGFPESVANRIATGELPMDAESVEARRIAQGYGDELYHGSTHDIREFNGQGNPSNDWGQGTYLSDSTHDVNMNYAGTHGQDFKSRVELEERQADLEAGGEQYAHDQAVARLKGENDGVIYPVRVKQDGILSVNDEVQLPDYNRLAAEELGYDPDKIGRYSEDIEYEIDERAWEIQAEDYDSPNAAMFGVGNEYGADMSRVYSIEEGNTWQDVRGGLNDVFAEDEAGNYVGSGAFAGEIMSRSGAKGVHDPSSVDRFPSMESGEHTVIFPGNENQIRSVNAAYDPQYTGSNIMGGAAGTAGLAGLLAAGQSEDADAGFITKGGKTLLEAFHGSPHKFDKFSMDQIGTGEGAQAYGHGLYFADSEQVARQYRDELSRTVNYDGKPLVQGNRPNSSLTTTGDETVNDHIIAAQGDVDAAIMQLEYDLKNYAPDDPNIPYDQDALKKLKQIKEDGLITIDDSAGALYRTEIDVTPESLLDWDKPLSEQPNALRAFQEMYSDEAMRLDPEILGPLYSNPADVDMATLGLFNKSKGAQAYNTIKDMNYVRGAPAMSEKLREKGIKGIKYLDGDSRAAGNGTSNYVIFDDSLINIAERGNATVPMLGATALGSAGLLAAPALMKGGVFQHTASETPIVERREPVRNQSSLLESVTDFNDEVIKSVKHAAGPLSLLMPYEGINDYLKVVNDYDKQPTWMDRLGLLDL